MRLNMEASLHGIAEKKPIKTKFIKVVIENQAMTTDCSLRYIDKARQRLEPQNVFGGAAKILARGQKGRGGV